MAASASAASSGGTSCRSPLAQHEVKLQEGRWQPFSLDSDRQDPAYHIWNNEVLLLSGCITSVSGVRLEPNVPAKVGELRVLDAPSQTFSFLAPSAMARHEAVAQRGTSCVLDEEGKLKIGFKHAHPMVLHFAGFCCHLGKSESMELSLAADGPQGAHPLDIYQENSLRFHRCEDTIFLKGELGEATYGPTSRVIGEIPVGYRPRRDLHFLAPLVRYEGDFKVRTYDQTVAVTLRTNGCIEVQGAKEFSEDKKGQLNHKEMNKKGNLCLDGLRYCLAPGEPIELAEYLRPNRALDDTPSPVDLSYLFRADESRAVAIRQGCGQIIILEGTLKWSNRGSRREPDPKKAIARLPAGCWPQRREVFFTRGGSDREERRRVDIDRWGRIFCPEGALHEKLTLTGIIFVTDPHAPPPPELPLAALDYDQLKLPYLAVADVGSPGSGAFQGHEQLEQFLRRCNHHDLQMVRFSADRHGGREMQMPLADGLVRGTRRENPQNIQQPWMRHLWNSHGRVLRDELGIQSFHALLQISDAYLETVHQKVQFNPNQMANLRELRAKLRALWARERARGLTRPRLQELAEELVEQIWRQWDFGAQVQGVFDNDFRPPERVQQQLPARVGGTAAALRRKIPEGERAEFDRVLQFFRYYETNGRNMTHSSLMGCRDPFTSTGKWHFPQTPEVQDALFKNAEWLFHRNICLNISERQTMQFPFIEDLDIQAPARDGEGGMIPPDHLIMNKPQRDGARVFGSPGELMLWRALAVHMVFPQFDTLTAYVYTASGYNKGKSGWSGPGMLKTSFHLVWPELLVDSRTAPIIRQATLAIFQRESNQRESFLRTTYTELLRLHEDNTWDKVFDQTTINARNGLRLPYSDKVSRICVSSEEEQRLNQGLITKREARMMPVRESRPSKAVGTIRFTFRTDASGNSWADGEWIEDARAGLPAGGPEPVAEWLQRGTCRRESSQASLTPVQLHPQVRDLLPRDQLDEMDRSRQPLPNIRICTCSVEEFQAFFLDQLEAEQDEGFCDPDLRRQLNGNFVMANETIAIWRTVATSQFGHRPDDLAWPATQIDRPAEVIYLHSRGKVIVDGPENVVEALLRCVNDFTRPDYSGPFVAE